MKIITYIYEGAEKIGYINKTGEKVIPFEEIGVRDESVNMLIENNSLEELLEKTGEFKKYESEMGITVENVKVCGPIPKPKQDIICLGINYKAHAEESARYKKEAFASDKANPIYFSKRVNRTVADLEPIDAHGDIVVDLDYEGELAVIIGKECNNVKRQDVEEYIFGYTAMNDVSARSIQTQHKQWYFGKSLDNFTPMGPCIVTRDEISYPPSLEIRSYVNGELRQNSNTKLLIHNIGEIVAQLSQGMTLEPGTIISTGTPEGVGMGFNPPKFLKNGDLVEIEIEGIGKLRNPVKNLSTLSNIKLKGE